MAIALVYSLTNIIEIPYDTYRTTTSVNVLRSIHEMDRDKQA
jgi:hypothetical protein